MHQPEQQQPEQAADLKLASLALGPGLLHEQIQPRAEQQREQAAHLAVDQDELRYPHPVFRVAARDEEAIGVHIGGKRLAEGNDIRRQDTHDGDAADEIETDDAVARERARQRIVPCSIGDRRPIVRLAHLVPPSPAGLSPDKRKSNPCAYALAGNEAVLPATLERSTGRRRLIARGIAACQQLGQPPRFLEQAGAPGNFAATGQLAP